MSSFRAWHWLAAILAVASCQCDSHYGNKVYACASTDECEPGFRCSDGLCRPEATGGSSGGGSAGGAAGGSAGGAAGGSSGGSAGGTSGGSAGGTAGGSAGGSAGGAPIVFEQGTADASGTRDAGSLTVSFLAPLKAGSTIVVAFHMTPGPPAVPIVTDTLGNTFTIIGPVGRGSGGFIANAIYLATSIGVAGGTDAVTVAMPGHAAYYETYIHEYSGIVSFEAAAGDAGTTSDVDGIATTPLNISGSNDLLFGFCLTGTASHGTGFTTRSAFHDNITEDRLVTTPGAYPATCTMDGGTWWLIAAEAWRGQ